MKCDNWSGNNAVDDTNEAMREVIVQSMAVMGMGRGNSPVGGNN